MTSFHPFSFANSQRQLFLAILVSNTLWVAAVAAQEVIRAGMIGLDTSHAPAFAKGLNDPGASGDMAKVRVVAAFPGGSPDLKKESADRVPGYTKELDGMGVAIVSSIDELLAQVDVVLLESVDGRPHLEQALPVFRAGKPVFIDKPLAGTLVDALAIDALGKETGTPWFTSSSLRFSPGFLEYRQAHPTIGDVTGCAAWSPCSLEPHHPDLYWYGIHGCEVLFTIMGPGVQTVSRVQTDQAELVSGTWREGRIGTFRGIRAPGASGYGAMVFGTKGITLAGKYAGYGPLLERIASFFVTREPPVSNAESLEIYAFMEAAEESKRRGGQPVSVSEVVATAQAQVSGRLKELRGDRER